MKEITLKISSKGQVTIPKLARDKLGVNYGDNLVLSINNGTVKLSRQKTIDDYYGKFKNAWTEGGKTGAVEIIRELRDRE